MSEELNTAPGATSPDIAAAAPVTPPLEAEPTEVPTAAPGEFAPPEAPAAAESVPPVDPDGPISAETGLPAEPLKAKIETPEENQLPPPPPEVPVSEAEAPAAEAEQQKKPEDPDPTEENIEKVIEVIKQTGKFNKVFLALETGIAPGTIRKIIPILEERKILGMRGATKVVLIETAKTPKKPEKPAQPQTPERKRVTDYDRLQMWKESLLNSGGFQNEELREAIAQYALRNPGFNPEERRGRTLITMLNRWAQRTRDRLKFFYQSDVDELHKMLLRFINENPLGNGPAAWNQHSSEEQLDMVRHFFRIGRGDKSFRDFTSNDRIINQVIDAARHSKLEEERQLGGSYGERLMYLVLAILAFATDERFFVDVIHDKPTEAFLERKLGGKVPSWNDGTKCLECGSELIKDDMGNTICSNMLCINHYSKVVTEFVPSSSDSNDAPTGGGNTNAGRSKRNWKKRGDSSDNEDQRGFDRSRRKGGKKWRQNDDEPQVASEMGGDAETVVSSGSGDGFHQSPFEGLELPVSEPPAAEATTPEA